MNWLDIVFLIILGVSIIGGLMRGFVREIFGLIGLIAGIFLAMLLSPAAAPHLERWMPPPVARAVAFVLIFFVISIVAALLGNLLTRFVESLELSCLNRLGGGVFGFVRGVIFIIVLFYGLLFLVKSPDQLMAGSRLAPLAYRGAQWLERIVPGHPWPNRDQVI